MKEVVRVWIGNPYENGKFNGTAFFIDNQTLVTAKHVVCNRAGEVYNDIYLGNTPDGGVIPVDEVEVCSRDLAILKVKKSFRIERHIFTKKIEEGVDVGVVGFYDKDSSQKTYENRISGYQSAEHTYELQNHLTNGLSGSPVFLEGKICGVAQAINIQKNLTYVIPITELCIESEEYFKERQETKKKLSLEQWASLATIVATVIALLAWLVPSIDSGLTVTTAVEQDTAVDKKQSQQRLSGTVSDDEGNPLTDVEVWENKTSKSTKSNKNGEYSFENIEGQQGEMLEVSFSKEGYFEVTEQVQLGEKHDVFLQEKVD